MALSGRQRMQCFGLVYWALAAIEMVLVIVAWNTSLITVESVTGIFMVNFLAGLCGLSALFILGAYMGEPLPNDRLLFNKEPFPRASGILAIVFVLVTVVLIVSTIKIGNAAHGYSSATPTASCADRVKYVVEDANSKWIRYKCVSHHEWLQVDKATSLTISAGSSFILVIFGTWHLGGSIAKGGRQDGESW